MTTMTTIVTATTAVTTKMVAMRMTMTEKEGEPAFEPGARPSIGRGRCP